MNKKVFPLRDSRLRGGNFFLALDPILCRGYTAAMQLVTPRAVAMAVRIEMAV